MVIWLIGLSAAGKSTVAQALVELLRARRSPVVMLDGDQVREVWGGDLGHSPEERTTNAFRIARLCRMLDGQGVDVVCAILSISPESRDWMRREVPGYFEVYLKVSLATARERDPKGLYVGADRGTVRQVVGVDIPFPEPRTPDLVLVNDPPERTPRELAEAILAALPESRAGK